MALQENLIKIETWPKEPARLSHAFEKPCPVSITFENAPANVVVQTSPERPLHVDMDMNVVARQPIPVCIKVCEPICARSDYTIGIDIFDRAVAAIRVKGMTRLFNCREEKEDL